MADHIARYVPVLPTNVRVVQADDPTSSYVFMDEAMLGFVYSSTVGLELAARGVPVLVAADTHYRGRGFTFDPNTDVIIGRRPIVCSAILLTRRSETGSASSPPVRSAPLLQVPQRPRSSHRGRPQQPPDPSGPGERSGSRGGPRPRSGGGGILNGTSTVAPRGSRPEGAVPPEPAILPRNAPSRARTVRTGCRGGRDRLAHHRGRCPRRHQFLATTRPS